MIDRSYLPYPSARSFQDRGMAKWTGFFLSEHTSALKKKEIDRSQIHQLSRQELLLLLSQSYSQQIPIVISYIQKERICCQAGRVFQFSHEAVLLKDHCHYFSIDLESILSVRPLGARYEPPSLPL